MADSTIDVLRMVRARLKVQLDVGIVSMDPDNEDPQHEFAELIPDLDDAIARESKRCALLKAAAEFIRTPSLISLRVEGEWLRRQEVLASVAQ